MACQQPTRFVGFPADFTTFLGQVNLSAVVFCIQAILHQAGGSIVISSIQDGSRANKGKAASIGYAISFTLNSVMGMLAYVDYGNSIKGEGDAVSDIVTDEVM